MLKEIWEKQKELNARTLKENYQDDYEMVIEIGKRMKNGEQLDYEDRRTVEFWLQRYTLAIIQECSELMDSTNWKWWRTKVDLFDPQNAVVELVDILHFWVSACQVMGLEPEDVFEVYTEKHAINHQRQDSGYTDKDEDDCREIRIGDYR